MADQPKANRRNDSKATLANIKKQMTPTTIGAAAVALAVGLVIGKFAFGASIGNVTETKAVTVSPDRGNEIVATYTYKGTAHTIALEDMFAYTGAASSAADSSAYAMPTTEQIVSYAREQILQDEAKNAGISVSDEEKLAYIKENWGSESMEDFATSQGRTVEDVDNLITLTLTNQKLFEQVAGKIDEMPAYPDSPEGGDEAADEKVEAYATYINDTVGDEFKDGKWADPEGDLATALPEYDGKTASYNDALAIYQVFYARNSESTNEAYSKWQTYNNEMLKDGSITIGTLIQ